MVLENIHLRVYKRICIKSFHSECKKLIKEYKLNRTEKDQLHRASFSVPLNIAEGSGKFSKPDRKNYFITARASVFECVAIVDILKDDEIISHHEFEKIELLADELSRILFTMIRNLSK
jgi:four helix bundle protein